jgi:hypothetical protein
MPLKARSFVGLIPLFAVETLEPDLLDRLPRFRRRMEWFIRYRPHLVANVCPLTEPGAEGRFLLSIASREQLERILQRMLDTEEFLSDYGLRSLSRHHAKHPFAFEAGGQTYSIGYEPADSTSGLFGGNSNWRGPIWFPLNYLMITSLRKYHDYFGNSLKAELPTGSDRRATLDKVSIDLCRRLVRIFLPAESDGRRRPVSGGESLFESDRHWQDHVLFYEYFHGDNGAGIGASHQTGWTALVANLIQESAGG